MPPSTHPFGIPCYLLRTLLKTSKPNVKYRCTYNCCKRSYSPNTENPDFLFFNFLCCGKSESFIAISETICVLLLIWSTDDLASYNLKEITWESGHCSFSCWRCKCSTYQWGSFILLWLLWVAVLLFRGTTGFFFPSGLALCSCSLPFWSEQNAGLMIHSSRKTFRWTSCFLKWYCFGKYASLDRKETVWHEIICWMLYHCVFLVWISYFTPTFVFISLSPTSDTIYTTHLYLLFSFNPLITSVIPMRQFH